MLGVFTVALAAFCAISAAAISRKSATAADKRKAQDRLLRNSCIAFGALACLCLLGGPKMASSIAKRQRKQYKAMLRDGVPEAVAATRVQGTTDGVLSALVLLPMAAH